MNGSSCRCVCMLVMVFLGALLDGFNISLSYLGLLWGDQQTTGQFGLSV